MRGRLEALRLAHGHGGGRVGGRPANAAIGAVAIGAVAIGALVVGCGEAEIDGPTLLPGGTPVEYPVQEWDADVEGIALVRVLVNAEGGVDSVMVAEGSGSAALDSAALRGAWEMEFEPALREGRALRVWARIPVHFAKPESEGAPEGPP